MAIISIYSKYTWFTYQNTTQQPNSYIFITFFSKFNSELYNYILSKNNINSQKQGDNLTSLKEKFNLLEVGVDFPFYNDIPKLSTAEWLLLLIPVIIMATIIAVPSIKTEYTPIIFGLITLIPALYVCKGNYSIFFKKPKKRDILTIILCLVGYYVYALGIGAILHFVFGYPVAGNAILTSFASPDAFLIISTLVQLIGEEFFKIFMLLILMYVVYKLTNNRRLAISLGVIVTLFVFGMIHYSAYSGRILQILLIQGLGSIFDLYAYMKTKNVVVSYILHVLIDYIPFTYMMIAGA